MKKASVSKKTKRSDLRREYRFDYRKSKPNRFAGKIPSDAIAVVLDPDVARVFDSSESVNTFLRSVISALADAKR